MQLYHGSSTTGLARLIPKQSDHDRPYVYLTTIEQVAALYLCNAVERPYYWFPYGFENGSDIPIYHELYPNALRQVSEGVKGCIYIVNAEEDEYIPFKNIPFARLGTVPLDVVDCIDVPDAYELLQEYISKGRLKVSHYEDKTPEQLEWWYSMVADHMKEKDMINTPECSYARFVREKLLRAWVKYLHNIDKT